MKLSNNEINCLKILFSKIDLKSYPELLHLKDKLSSKITVDLYIDGSADLKTKTAGIGGVIFIDNKESHSFSEYLHDSTNNCFFALANALYLPFPDNYFDALYSFGALGEFSSPQTFFKEVARVCKTGAKVVVGDENLPIWQRKTLFGKILSI